METEDMPLEDYFSLCRESLREKRFVYHKLPDGYLLWGKWKVSVCIARYNPRTNKTMLVYLANDWIMVLYAIKKKYFVSPISIPSGRYIAKNAVKHHYVYGIDYKY